MNWKAWYTEGRFYTSDDLSWEELPEIGAQVFVFYLADGTRMVLDGADWYWYDGINLPGRLNSANEWGSHLPAPDLPPSILKRGDGLPYDEYKAIFDDAWNNHKKWTD